MSVPRELIDAASSRLSSAGLPSPRADAETLLAFVLDVPRVRLLLCEVIDEATRAAFDAAVRRREAGAPLQHIVGRVTFRHSELAVGPGAFVPRPETEVVAGAAIEFARSLPEEPVVVDLGTGTGAIALAAAEEVSSARVYACELDPAAYAWAERNLAGSGVALALADIADVEAVLEPFPALDGATDVVVSNPPYIPLAMYEQVPEEVRRHDPVLALWSGQDGLDAIRAVERAAARLLRPGGRVFVEHADVQGESAPAEFAASGRWSDVREHEDLNGRPRYVTAVLAGQPRASAFG